MNGKRLKAFRALLGDCGYEFDHRSSKGRDIYIGSDGHELSISAVPDDREVKYTTRDVQKRFGLTTAGDCRKRHPVQIKDRQATERERAAAEVDRHLHEIADLLRQRDHLLGGLGRILTDREVTAISRQIEQHERELVVLRRQMQDIPSVNAHSGRIAAQHRA